MIVKKASMDKGMASGDWGEFQSPTIKFPIVAVSPLPDTRAISIDQAYRRHHFAQTTSIRSPLTVSVFRDRKKGIEDLIADELG